MQPHRSGGKQAADHFDLLNGLWVSRGEYSCEMNVSNTFWHLTFIAHRDAALSHLCRLYDKDTAALSLVRFLKTVKENRDLFSDVAFRERLKGNEHVDALIQDRAIDDSEIEAELASVDHSDPLLSRLMDLRNHVISHTAADRVRRSMPNPGLPAQEVGMLLNRARSITEEVTV